jgi:predicted KAP-like P-loop ATPase
VLTAGSVITEPAAIKHFRSRLDDRKIIEVTEHNFDKYYQIFKDKFGIEIPSIKVDVPETKPVVVVARTL